MLPSGGNDSTFLSFGFRLRLSRDWLRLLSPVHRGQGSALAVIVSGRRVRSERRSGSSSRKLSALRYLAVSFPEHVIPLHVETAFCAEVCQQEFFVDNVQRPLDLEHASDVLSVSARANLDLIPDHIGWKTAKDASRIGDGTTPADSRVITSRKALVKPLYTRPLN